MKVILKLLCFLLLIVLLLNQAQTKERNKGKKRHDIQRVERKAELKITQNFIQGKQERTHRKMRVQKSDVLKLMGKKFKVIPKRMKIPLMVLDKTPGRQNDIRKPIRDDHKLKDRRFPRKKLKKMKKLRNAISKIKMKLKKSDFKRDESSLEMGRSERGSMNKASRKKKRHKKLVKKLNHFKKMIRKMAMERRMLAKRERDHSKREKIERREDKGSYKAKEFFKSDQLIEKQDHAQIQVQVKKTKLENNKKEKIKEDVVLKAVDKKPLVEEIVNREEKIEMKNIEKKEIVQKPERVKGKELKVQIDAPKEKLRKEDRKIEEHAQKLIPVQEKLKLRGEREVIKKSNYVDFKKERGLQKFKDQEHEIDRVLPQMGEQDREHDREVNIKSEV